MNKTCTKCGETKLVSEFFRAKAKKDGYHTWCKFCLRIYNKKRCATKEYSDKRKKWNEKNRFVYALTHSKSVAKLRGHMPCTATAKELEAAFTGKCDLCGVPEQECNQKLHMDHNHETGEFRGFLCARCNMGLGYFRDSEELLIDALHFLMNTNKKEIHNG